MITTAKSLVFKVVFFSLMLGLITTILPADWETPIRVIGPSTGTRIEYKKPEIAFAPNGNVYIVFEEKERRIGLTYFKGKVKQGDYLVSGNREHAFQPDIVVTADGVVHLAWVEAINLGGGNYTEYVMYRRFEDGYLSNPIQFGSLGANTVAGQADVLYDLRMAVDGLGNIHITAMKSVSCKIWYFSKYEGYNPTQEQLYPRGMRQKHPDIAVNDQYVNVVWLDFAGEPYAVWMQKWENKYEANKPNPEVIVYPGYPDPVRPYTAMYPRVKMDNQGLLHLFLYLKRVNANPPDKLGVYFREKKDSDPTKGSGDEMFEMVGDIFPMVGIWHYPEVRVRDKSIIFTTQDGTRTHSKGLAYRWGRRESIEHDWEYEDAARIAGTEGAYEASVDLSFCGNIAAMAYNKRSSGLNNAVIELVYSKFLQAEFTYSPQKVMWDKPVEFDASRSITNNPDKSIVEYKWDFGDGTVIATSSPTINHAFSIYESNPTQVFVSLEVRAASGEVGFASEEVNIYSLNNAVIEAVVPKQVETLFHKRLAFDITWSANSANQEYQITGYEIWRAISGATLSPADFSKMWECGAEIREFLDFQGIQAGIQYEYVVRSVDVAGNISPIQQSLRNSSTSFISRFSSDSGSKSK